MYFLTLPLVSLGRRIFLDTDFVDPQAGNDFFETFGPGNMFYFTDKPFERFSDYEELLTILQHDDPTKYNQMHKGVPFYFLSWTAFDMKNYEKALFYMDAAISEDIRSDPDGWINDPAGSFLTLGQPDMQSATRSLPILRNTLEEQLSRFNAKSGMQPISSDDFVEKFVNVLVRDISKRTIITAFYTYLLESRDRLSELSLRSVTGGSIEPFLAHLFKGGLVFESLLKHLYPCKDNGRPARTIGDIFTQNSIFQADFLTNVQTSANDLQTIVDNVAGNDMQCAFDTTSRLRNTTGHNLAWPDAFEYPDKYAILVEQQINAILYIITVKFL